MAEEGESARAPPFSATALQAEDQMQMQAEIDTHSQAQSRPRKRKRPPSRRKTVRWSQREVDALLSGVRVHGVGKWAAILRHSQVFNGVRTSVDLKDKWRNLTSPVRAAALAASGNNPTSIGTAPPCSAPTSSSSAPIPIVSNPTASASFPDVSMADTPANVHPTIMDMNKFASLSEPPIDAQDALDFDDAVNMSSPNSSSPELCLPRPSNASEARTPLPNPPSESSVSPELLTDMPLDCTQGKPSSLQQTASPWTSNQQSDASQLTQAQAQDFASPSIPNQHVQTPVIPLQHQASVQSALHRTLAQSSALVEYWRTLAAHPTLCRHVPVPTNSQSVMSYLFGNEDDEDDDEDEDDGEGDRKPPVTSFPYSPLPFSNLSSAPSVVPISQAFTTATTAGHEIPSQALLQQQWVSQAQIYSSYLAAYNASQLAQQEQNSTQSFLGLAAGTVRINNSDGTASPDPNHQMVGRLEQPQEDSDAQTQLQAQPRVDPQLLMQVLRNMTPGDFQS